MLRANIPPHGRRISRPRRAPSRVPIELSPATENLQPNATGCDSARAFRLPTFTPAPPRDPRRRRAALPRRCRAAIACVGLAAPPVSGSCESRPVASSPAAPESNPFECPNLTRFVHLEPTVACPNPSGSDRTCPGLSGFVHPPGNAQNEPTAPSLNPEPSASNLTSSPPASPRPRRFAGR